jgi:peptide/nickel transport system substrate-binding protein
MNFKNLVFIQAAALFSITFFQPIAEVFATESASAKEEITIGVSQEFDTLHPMIAQMLVSNYIFNLGGRSLLVLDADGKWIPQLAKKIPSLENGGAKIIDDKTEKVVKATWEIIPSAKWSDGTPVTCADFKLSLDIANSGTVAVSGKEEYTVIKSIDWNPKTPKKCNFISKGLRWDFYQIPRFIPMPSHIEGPVFEKFGKDLGSYDKNSNYSKNPTLPGLYNGPYIVSEVKPGSHVSLVVNPYFYGPKPSIKKVIVKVLPDTGSLEAQFLTGAVNVVGPVGIGFDQALRLDKKFQSEQSNNLVQFKPALTYEQLQVNLDNPFLKDLRVRQALMYGLNRKDLISAFFENRQTIAHHFLPAVDPWFTDNPTKVKVFEFNKAKAEKLLSEAGWELNKTDGYRYKNGDKLSFQLMSTSGNKIREITEAFIQQNWKEIGVEITIKNEPPRVFFGETVKKRKFPAFAMFATTVFPEKTPSQFHSKSIPNDSNGWSGRNTMGWSNKKVDKLVEGIESEMNGKKRLKAAQDLQKLFSEELPCLSLFYRSDVALLTKNLKNYQLTGHQFSETNQAENWGFQ